jgi:flagellar protein FlgJ
MDGEQGKMMQGMLDQQYARTLSSRGIGLADVLARQLSPQIKPQPTPAAATDRMHGESSRSAAPAGEQPIAQPPVAQSASRPAMSTQGAYAATVPASSNSAAAARTPQAFTGKLASHAEAASAATGIPAKFMLGQAALETGWGRREIRHADGSNSHNVFGIKAGNGWRGKVAEVTTTEYIDGVAHKRTARFRAYDSYADAFHDYARMLSTSPRYRDAVASVADAGGFADALQRAGYATDPFYAKKLKGVIAKV